MLRSDDNIISSLLINESNSPKKHANTYYVATEKVVIAGILENVRY